MHRSNYSKIENGQREISLAVVDKIAGYFIISIDELIHMGDDIPKEISLEDKTTVEQVKIIPSKDLEHAKSQSGDHRIVLRNRNFWLVFDVPYAP